VASAPPLSAKPRRAEYALFPDEEEPTQPGVVTTDDRGATLTRLYANLTPEERRKLVLLADAWFRCGASERVLLEATAQVFADNAR
jgi:hypothetical protein